MCSHMLTGLLYVPSVGKKAIKRLGAVESSEHPPQAFPNLTQSYLVSRSGQLISCQSLLSGARPYLEYHLT